MGWITIEYDDRNNGSTIHPSTSAPVRGKFSRLNIRPNTPNADLGLDAMPDIPGMCVSVDPEAKIGRIYDPLAAQDHKTTELLARINRVHLSAFKTTARPIQPREYVLDGRKLNTWLWWMKQWLAEGRANLLEGVLPDEIKGEIDTNFFDRSQNAQKKRQAGPNVAPVAA